MRTLLALVVACGLLARASAAEAPRSPDVDAHRAHVEAARSRGQRNARSQDEKDLIAADLEFADSVRSVGVAEAFATRFLPDGKLIGPGSVVRVGPQAVRAALADDKAVWRWAPEEARASGDLGVTWGVAAIAFKDDKGVLQSIQTRYVTVWRRSDAGWRIWLDIGNRGPAYDPQG